MNTKADKRRKHGRNVHNRLHCEIKGRNYCNDDNI